MKKRWMKAATAVAAFSLIGAACGGDDDEIARSGDATTTTTEATDDTGTAEAASASTETEAATLRKDLTLLLRNHVNLTGHVVYVASETALDSEQTKAASAALDENTVALGEAIGGLFGDDAEEEFLRQWREHIGFFVDYATGIATDDQQLKESADQKLRGQYTEDFSAFVSGATDGGLPQDAVKQSLTKHIDTLEQAIESILTQTPDAGSQLLEAGRHMNATAAALASGFAAAKELEGDPKSPASELQATLTGALEQHVAQTAVVVHEALRNGLDSEQAKQATAALDENTVAIGEAIGSVYGDDAEQQFLDVWRQHIEFFTSYAKGVATGDEELKQQADDNLRGQYTETFSTFLETATDGRLAADAVKKVLTEHIDTLEQTIESILTTSPEAGSDLREALRHMQNPAMAISGAIVDQFPEKFAG